jgi:hypothetical protein
MTPPTWFDQEAPLTRGSEQAARLLVAAVRRPKLLILVALVYGAAIAAAVLLTRPVYAPEYILRVLEPETAPTGAPRPPRHLAEYVRTAVFTSGPLSELVNRYGLYPSLAKKNPHAALESFREDIEVSTRQNYFVEDRPAGAAPRSARLVIGYRANDPELAVNVTRQLGELVVEREREARRNEAERAASFAKEQLGAARDALAIRRSEVVATAAELERDADAPPERRIRLIGLLGSIPALERKQDERERRAGSLALGAALERDGAGLRFEVVDDASVPPDTGARAIGAVVAFFAGLPLLALAVGALTPASKRT